MAAYPPVVDLAFGGEIFSWRGPAPYLFVAVPPEECAAIGEVAQGVTYGWGMIPVSVRAGVTTWTTSLWPRDGGYVVPIKVAVQRAEGVGEGDHLDLVLTVDL